MERALALSPRGTTVANTHPARKAKAPSEQLGEELALPQNLSPHLLSSC